MTPLPPAEPEPKTYLFILNDGPYGQERPYTALRLAVNLAKRRDLRVRLYLAGDGVQCAFPGQEPPEGIPNIEHMIRSLIQHGEVGYSGLSAEMRGLKPRVLIEGVKHISPDSLAEWAIAAEHILVF
ncbi:MAG: DsrE family protein [Anaerolineales bacterium]|nr:DsrE family protein [Anaerolineales bacterium]